jgi:hypothetical protein
MSNILIKNNQPSFSSTAAVGDAGIRITNITGFIDPMVVTSSFLTREADSSVVLPFAMTSAGFITPMITGLLSACSSGLILYVISRSQQKLSTTYHRIMGLMSFFDIVASIFIALGTVMMPADSVFQFAGQMVGNQASCHAQGWLIIFGNIGVAAMNACLAWYFVCRIALKIDFVKIRNRIEPVMYIYTLILSLFAPSVLLTNDLLNSTPYESFCTIGPHAIDCPQGMEYDQWMSLCNMGEGADEVAYNRFFLILVFIYLIQFLLILLGMSITLWTVYSNHKEMRTLVKKSNDDDNLSTGDQNDPEQQDSNSKLLSDTMYTRVLIFQALMYILAFMLTWSLNSLSGVFRVSTFSLDAINSVIFPLQGLWNLIIFLYDKSYLIRRRDANITFLRAAIQIISSPSSTPVMLFSNISTVADKVQESQKIDEKPHVIQGEVSNVEETSHNMSAYDDISKLRGDISQGLSNVNSSDPMSSASDVISHEQAPRTNLVNVRKSWKQVQREEVTDVEKSSLNVSGNDEYSNLGGDFSQGLSSVNSSEPMSLASDVISHEQAPRTNLVNVRKSWKQVKREEVRRDK